MVRSLVRVLARATTAVLGGAFVVVALYLVLATASERPAAADSAGLTTGVPEPSECEVAPVLAPGSTGADVRCLQYSLIVRGYDVPYSGTYDDATREAVRAFQGATPPLSVDGRAGSQTLLALGIRIGDDDDPPPVVASSSTSPGGSTTATPATPTSVEQRDETYVELPTSSLTCLADAHLKVGSTGPSVTCLQKRLAELGMYRGKANGTFDGALADAVEEFQSIRPPLSVDGVAGTRTLAALGIWSGISPGAVPAGTTVSTASFPAAGASSELQWHVTAEGIPYYGSRTPCTAAQAATIAYEFARDGADTATQQWAVYIASREGGCRYDAVNQNAATRDDSHCTFQINALSGVFGPTAELGRRGWTAANIKASLQACADAASDLWVFCGRGPWTPPYSCAPPWGGALSSANVPSTASPTATTTPTTTPTATVPATTAPTLPMATSPPTPTLPVATTPTTPSIPATTTPAATATTHVPDGP